MLLIRSLASRRTSGRDPTVAGSSSSDPSGNPVATSARWLPALAGMMNIRIAHPRLFHAPHRSARRIRTMSKFPIYSPCRMGDRLPRQRSSEGYESRIKRMSAFGRSEEHTSELQSLMRISYAVLCLKKKIKKKSKKNNAQSIKEKTYNNNTE